MKKFLILVSLPAVLLSGCATTRVSSSFPENAVVDGGRPLAVVHAENYGYYLFSVVPLFAGNPDRQNENSMTFFTDTVTVENNRKMIVRHAEELGAVSIADVRNHTDWTGGFSLWIVWKQVLSSNAVLLK